MINDNQSLPEIIKADGSGHFYGKNYTIKYSGPCFKIDEIEYKIQCLEDILMLVKDNIMVAKCQASSSFSFRRFTVTFDNEILFLKKAFVFYKFHIIKDDVRVGFIKPWAIGCFDTALLSISLNIPLQYKLFMIWTVQYIWQRYYNSGVV